MTMWLCLCGFGAQAVQGSWGRVTLKGAGVLRGGQDISVYSVACDSSTRVCTGNEEQLELCIAPG